MGPPLVDPGDVGIRCKYTREILHSVRPGEFAIWFEEVGRDPHGAYPRGVPPKTSEISYGKTP